MTVFTSSWQVRAEAGEPFAVIRVRDLQGTIQAGTDAWGRKNKTQPVVISAELSMAKPFDAASSSDRVSDDTVHYGLLAKAILASLEGINKKSQSASASHVSLDAALEQIWTDLTGMTTDGRYVEEEKVAAAFLSDKLSMIRYMNLSVTLPKASLLGSGVSKTVSGVFGSDGYMQKGSICLRHHGLRVPTLVGVNDNERLARQVVVVDVEIEGFGNRDDAYVDIESIVVKTLGDSSFETLEALGPAITSSIKSGMKGVEGGSTNRWVIKVTMEKPTAITMAAASRVEYREPLNDQSY